MVVGCINSWILFILQWLVTCRTLTSALQCICTTQECIASNNIACTAANLCYVQKLQVKDTKDGHETREEYTTVRGCIDESMPLLCENRRPDHYTGPWPILHCCQQNWCNKDLLPTDPPWLLQNKDSQVYELPKYDGLNPRIPQNKRSEFPQERDSSQAQTSEDFNVLYIAVPVAGACVMLALVIFTLYLLKMKRRRIKQCVKRQPGGLAPIYRQQGGLAPICRHKLSLIIGATDSVKPSDVHSPAKHVVLDSKKLKHNFTPMLKYGTEYSVQKEGKLLV